VKAKPIFRCLNHQVAHQAGVNASGRRQPAHDFPITACQRKGHPDPFAIAASQFKPIRTPASADAVDGDLAVMRAGSDGTRLCKNRRNRDRWTGAKAQS
jgi:hypothetical protein